MILCAPLSLSRSLFCFVCDGLQYIFAFVFPIWWKRVRSDLPVFYSANINKNHMILCNINPCAPKAAKVIECARCLLRSCTQRHAYMHVYHISYARVDYEIVFTAVRFEAMRVWICKSATSKYVEVEKKMISKMRRKTQKTVKETLLHAPQSQRFARACKFNHNMKPLCMFWILCPCTLYECHVIIWWWWWLVRRTYLCSVCNAKS